jgi:hypothetical protein
MPGDKNGGLVYSHLQNSTTAGDILSRLGMVVGNKMLEDSDTCFLSGGVHKLRSNLYDSYKKWDLIYNPLLLNQYICPE